MALVVKIWLIKYIFVVRLIGFENFLEGHLQKSIKLELTNVENINQVNQHKPQKRILMIGQSNDTSKLISYDVLDMNHTLA